MSANLSAPLLQANSDDEKDENEDSDEEHFPDEKALGAQAIGLKTSSLLKLYTPLQIELSKSLEFQPNRQGARTVAVGHAPQHNRTRTHPHGKLRSKTYEHANIGRHNNFLQQATAANLNLKDFQSSARENSFLSMQSILAPSRLSRSGRVPRPAKIKKMFDNLRDIDLAKKPEFERQNFDPIDNEITHLESCRLAFNGKSMPSRGLLKWFTCIIIGIITGLCMALVTFSILRIEQFKWKWYKWCLQKSFWAGIGFFTLVCFACAIVASCAVLMSPEAAGSGIPDVKAYLNGTHVPRLFDFRTLAAKLIGITAAVCGSFMVGKEGPMVHSGSSVANQIGRAGIWCMPERFSSKYLFGTDIDRRDLISCGAAAGVAAAFSAPIGGMLFALEECSSFWRAGLNWRALMTAAVSNFTALAVLACMENLECGTLQKKGLINFLGHPASDVGVYDLVNMACFVLIGILGGLLGALFNYINIELTKKRNRFAPRKCKIFSTSFLDVLCVAFVTVFIIMVLPSLPVKMNECRALPCQVGADDDACDNLAYYGQFMCDDGYYNPMAALLQAPKESVVESLFYYRDPLEWNQEWFPNTILWIAFLCYFFIGVITYGIGIPSGLFIPIICIGSSLGHVIGKYFNSLVQHSTHTRPFDVGTFSLLGAAALLGGTTRMTISLTVILVEISTDIYYLVPIITVIIIAKWVGDRMNGAIYDAHIILKGIPFLEPTLPKSFPTWLTAQDIMVSPVVTLPRICSLKRVLHVLSNKKFCHSAFPIVMQNPSLYGNQQQVQQPTQRKSTGLDEDDEHEMQQRMHEAFHGNAGTGRMSRKSILENEKVAYRSDGDTQHIWIGLMLRNHIMSMLRKKCYARRHSLHKVKRLNSLQLEKLSFSFKEQQLQSLQDKQGKAVLDIDGIMYQQPTEEENGDWLDFSPYMNLSPFTVRENTPLTRVYALFRTLGLRHCIVTNHTGNVVGMITQKELHEHHLEKIAEEIVERHSEDTEHQMDFVHQRLSFLRSDEQYGHDNCIPDIFAAEIKLF